MIGVMLIVAAFGPIAADSPSYERCLSRAAGAVQSNMCTTAELAREDSRLNAVYKDLMRQWRTVPARQRSLQQDERRWIRDRDRTCREGSVLSSECLLRMTSERADFLENQGHL